MGGGHPLASPSSLFPSSPQLHPFPPPPQLHPLSPQDTLAAGFNAPPINLPGLPLYKAIQARTTLLQQLDAVLDAWDATHGQRQKGNGQRGKGTGQKGNGQVEQGNAETGGVVPAFVSAACGGDLTRDELRDNAIAALFGNVSAGPTLAKVRC